MPRHLIKFSLQMSKVHKVYEFTGLQYEPNLRWHKPWFEKRHYNALVDYHDNKGGHKYFSLIRNGVLFSQYVGVLQVKDLTIEILPKTDKEDEKNVWHDVLLNMLRQTKFLQLDYISEASLRYKRHSILHLYFMEFLHQVQLLMKRGLIKKYRKKTGNLNVLKGSIQFNEHITRNVIHKEKFYTKHQIYDHQHILHQIILEALLILQNITTQSLIADEVNRTLFQFPEIERRVIIEKTFKTLTFNRKTKPYKKAIEIAKMIILNYSPDIKGGNNDLFALLFDMNQLWEEFIYRQLLKIDDPNLTVHFQNQESFWESRKLRPDLIIEKDGQRMILDTKWKIIDNAQPSDEDLRQIFAYNIYWGVNKGFLVYPKTSSSPLTAPGIYHKGHKAGKDNMSCQVIYVDVVRDGMVNERVGMDLFNNLQINPLPSH
jgi:5-methylcytosine-specific restriction enzyme subunit McrC